MIEYKIISANDTNDVSLWLEEYCNSFENGYWDYNVKIDDFCKYAYLRDAIFTSKIWGIMEIEDGEIIGIFLTSVNPNAEDCLVAHARVYLSKGIELLEYSTQKMKDLFEDDFSKIQFNFLCKDGEKNNSSILEIKDLIKEVSIPLGRKRREIYSLFLV